MAIKIGIIGEPNTGKSYSRKFIEKGEEIFVLAPSAKSRHITNTEGEPLKRLNASTSISPTLEDMAIKLGKQSIHEVIPALMNKEGVTITGNYIVGKLQDVYNYLQIIDKEMPNIKTVIIPDFTHFISAILADRKFISRKAGGEAFQRFWELAGDALEGIILSIDNLREDLLVITEYHSQYNEISDTWEIFVPGGKMLTQAFKLDSYYDFMFYTHVVKKDNGEVESYNFVTRKWDKYNARSAELFKETLIPNNLDTIIKEVRKYNGI
jgi:hypothetical protein